MNEFCRLTLLAWLVFWATPCPLPANNIVAPSYSVRTWQTEEGLPHNSVAAILQTRDGFLWVATGNGVGRFDGVKFTVFNDKNTPALKAPSIKALCETSDGSLWIGTWGGGLVRYKDGTFFHFEKKDGLSGNLIRTLHSGSDGTLWIGTTLGTCQFKEGKFLKSDEFRIADAGVRAIAEDKDGKLYFAADNDNIVPGDGKPVPLQSGIGALVNARALLCDNDGDLWLGVKYSLLRWNPRSKTPEFVDAGLSHNLISVIHQDHRGTLWVGTYDGLNQRLKNTAEFMEVKNNGESFGLVQAIYTDREGNLWVGTSEGLNRLQQNRFTTYTKQQGLAHDNISCITEDGQGTIKVGTWGGGVSQINDAGIVSLNLAAPFLLVSTLFESPSGELWVSSQDTGALQCCVPGDLDSSTLYGRANGYIDRAAKVICRDRAGVYWIGTRSALVQFTEGRFTRYTVQQGLPGDNIFDLCLSRTGDLWIGTDKGLSRKNGEHFENFTTAHGLADNFILSLFEDKEGDLWIGTRRGGLSRFKNGRFQRFNAFPNEEINAILEDDDGWLWVASSEKGIFSIEKSKFSEVLPGNEATIPFISYRKGDGLLTTECSNIGKPSAWKSKDGRLWFAMKKGLSVVDPGTARETNTNAPPVAIESVIGNDEERPLTFIQRGPAESALTFKPGRGELEINYTALSFTAPEKNQFRYKLEHHDADWVDAGSRRTAYYNNLPPGSYTFRVKACNNDGVWNEEGATMKLVLRPHFWQTWWFGAGLVFGAVGVVGGTARHFARKRFRRKLEILEQQHAIEKERTRIARDMHDDLGARLTEILLLNNAAKKNTSPEQAAASTAKVSGVVREAIDNLDALVWAVNPGNDSLQKLASYICEYAASFLKSASIPCRFDPLQDAPAIPLSSETRHNVFLVVKEALNNIAKYSGATEVWIRFQHTPGHLTIAIEDNGKGFVMAEAGSRGNGLQNMRKRIEEVNGKIEISSEAGEGTRIQLRVPFREC